MSTGTLKKIALISMIIDHIGFFFYDYSFYTTFRIIGRLAAPIFMFCMIEGYLHTSDRGKYKQRLGIAALGMGTLNIWMIMIGKLIEHSLPSSFSPITPNIFLTLFISFLIIETIDKLINKDIKIIDYPKFLLVLTIPFIEYSYIAIATILIFRYIGNKVVKFTLFTITSIIICLIMENNIQLFMIFVIPFLYNYNGEKGIYNKWLFYIAYPASIYLAWLVSILV